MSNTDSDFVHRFVPGRNDPSVPTLLLLHGTGGDENDLLAIGQEIIPGAALLSPRGKVQERGMPRFFRRLSEGVFDLEDLTFRTHEMARFVEQAAATYGFDLRNVIAVGYSNGANIAASILLLYPHLLAGAILFRAMVPLEPPDTPDLAGVPIFIGAARFDQIVPPDETERLAAQLQSAGAAVTIHWHAGTHALSLEDVGAARQWLHAHQERSSTLRTTHLGE